MKAKRMDCLMRTREGFRNLRTLPNAWLILRIDGCGFTRLSQKNFIQPFDICFHNRMGAVAEHLMREFQGVYAYTQSDEVSVLISPHSDKNGRSVESLVARAASIASAGWAYSGGPLAYFDAHSWTGASLEDVSDYFRWRMADSMRNSLDKWVRYILAKDELKPSQIHSRIEQSTFNEKNAIVEKFCKETNTTIPLWQRRGTAIFWVKVPVQGENPLTREVRPSIRRKLLRNSMLETGERHAFFVQDRIHSGEYPNANGYTNLPEQIYV